MRVAHSWFIERLDRFDAILKSKILTLTAAGNGIFYCGHFCFARAFHSANDSTVVLMLRT